jgi:carbamoylphosphate synthase small subunit
MDRLDAAIAAADNGDYSHPRNREELARMIEEDVNSYIEVVDDRELAEQIRNSPHPDYLAVAAEYWPEIE